MPDDADRNVTIAIVTKRTMVSLKVSKAAANGAAGRLQLATPLRASGSDPQSLWLGPGQWLLTSASHSADVLIGQCAETLAGDLHIAVDFSAALTAYSLKGPAVRELLASGSGLDFRPAKYPAGTCCRTRFAQVAVVIVAAGADEFELYADRSYGAYLYGWLMDSVDIVAAGARYREADG